MATPLNELQMKMEKVSFMGQTMGGRVGMILALTQPHLFDKLICVDSTPRQVSMQLLILVDNLNNILPLT